MSTITTTLLRRTLVSLGAAFALATGTQVSAATVTLSGATSNSCSYDEMKVQPNGNITVTCGGTSTPGVANFALTASTSSLTPNTQASATVTRTGGPAEALMVSFSVGGNGCSPNSGGIMLNANQSSSIQFSIGASGSNCVVTIGAPAGHTASPSSITFTAGTTTNPNPNPNPSPGDCPAIPLTSVAGDPAIKDFQTVDWRRSSSPGSGNVLYYQVPASINAASVKVTFDQGISPNTPAGTTEFQVSPCPGVFNPPGHTIANQCRFGPSDTQNAVFTIWTAPAIGMRGENVQSQTDLPLLCYAPIGSRTYYINIRHVYNCTISGCGHNMKWRERNDNGTFD